MQANRLKAAGELLDQEPVASFLVLSTLAMVLVPALAVALLLRCHVQVLWWTGPLLAVVTVLALGRTLLGRAGLRHPWFAPGVLLLSLVAIGVLCGLMADISADGATYHTEAVLGLERGINPVTTPFPGPMAMWTNHYPKLTWYFAAAVAKTTGNFQLGKSYTLLLALGCWVYARRWLRHMGVRPGCATLTATAMAANPVTMSQMVSMYLDGAMASLLTLAVLACVALVFGEKRWLDCAVLASVSVMLVSTKFTGLAYLAVLWAATGLCMLVRERGRGWRQQVASLRPLGLTVAVTVFIGVLVLGFNPYVTNMERGLHPMYPLAGPGHIDIMAHHISPVAFTDPRRNRVQNLVTSVMSRSQPNLEAPAWKVPFTTSVREIRSFAAPDVHLAGWGVFFSGVLLASIVMWVYGRGWRASAASLAAGLVLLTVLVNPYAWWARFAPQMALLPVFLLVPWMAGQRTRAMSRGHRIALVLCSLLVLDGVINAGCAMLASAVPTMRMHHLLARIADECGSGTYLAYTVPGAIPYHYEPFSGDRGITIETAGTGTGVPAGSKAYRVGVSWAPAELVRVGECQRSAPGHEPASGF